MKIVIDENIVYGADAFSKFGNVEIKSGRDIINESVKDADALIVRSITQINRKLLEGSKVKFVGTATIGVDHVDLDFLRKKNIEFAHAPGCNSQAVAEYIFSAITHLFKKNEKSFKNKTIGIIGAGNIGSKIVKMSKALGINVLVNDPPLQRKLQNFDFCSLEDVLKADIVTLHVPLILEGIDKTYHLLDEKELNYFQAGKVLINSSRGPVINNSALLKKLQKQRDFFTIIDVWENEPNINVELMKKVDIATPHIAGYSFEGKVNGTKMIYDAFCKFFNFESNWTPNLPVLENNLIAINNPKSIEEILYTVFNKIYDIWNDHDNLKKILTQNPNKTGYYFDLLRKNYKIRRELSSYSVIVKNISPNIKTKLKKFGLNLVS